MTNTKSTGFSSASLLTLACSTGLVLAVTCAHAGSKNENLDNDMRTPMSVSAASEDHAPKALHSKEHSDIDKALAQEEARCYQQFSVNRCLADARTQARTERAALDTIESEQKAAARQEASEAHRVERAQRGADHAAARASASGSAPSHTESSSLPAARAARAARAAKPMRSPDVEGIRQERAASQRQRDERAARARTRKAEKRAAAERHQASMQQRRNDRDAQGKAAAAPLPAPQAAASVSEPL